ncbi:hypothetical protein DFH07DRAFT_731738, partial [Mycena maculata]
SPELMVTTISPFKARLIKHGYNPGHILPHGSYLVDLSNPDVPGFTSLLDLDAQLSSAAAAAKKKDAKSHKTAFFG